jgi:Zn-dependent protease with chaperone function
VSWKGFYYDGQTADKQEVTVSIAGGGVAIHKPDGSTTIWPVGELKQTQGSFSSEQLRIERGTAVVEVLFVTQPGLPAAIRQAFPDARTSVKGSRSTALLLGWTAGIIAASIAAYVWGAPLFAGWLAPRVPASWEVSLGQDVAERMAPKMRQCGDSASLAHLRTVLDRLIRAAPKTDYNFRMVVLKDSSVNAFAAPGGFIAVHSGLIQASTTPEQFAGVLAHEIQHVLQRHSTRAVIREVPLRLAISAVAGGGAFETAASVAGSLGALRYRRADESEADLEGMRLLAAARIDPTGAVEIMRTLQAKGANAPRFVTYLSSHPQTAQRVAELEALARASRVQSTPLMDSAAWERVRQMCVSADR